MADTPVLGAGAERLAGSTPAARTGGREMMHVPTWFCIGWTLAAFAVGYWAGER